MWETRLWKRTEIDDQRWNAFVDASPQQYLYFYTWFLDAACPDWLAITVSHRGKCFLQWPLPVKRKAFLRYAFQPRLTQFGGPLLAPFEGPNHQRQYLYKVALQHAIAALPKLFVIDINLHPSLDFFLPFHWAGFEVRPRYTYWLPLAADVKAVEARFSSSTRRNLDKSRKEGCYTRLAESPDNLLMLARQADIFDAGHEQAFRRIWQVLVQHGAGHVLEAFTADGQLAGAAAYVLDGVRTIYLSSALEPELRRSDAGTLLVAEGIAMACRNHCQWFDFEGSMIPSVEQFFRKFNPVGKVYWNVSRRWPG
ncbi:MAG: hypothetical protein KatS3mg029_0451 [Saprospiraceae bacterium]|nr:MAG: hypothetical protein KatS3mg029_0451 [Saprospiraceae bacterium]